VTVPLAAAAPFADAVYRRRIELRPAAGAIEAEMEDWPHHFRLRITHDGCVVQRAEATAVRYPWSSCPLGAAGIASLAGLAIGDAVEPARWAPDRSAHCVHVFDLALLAVRHTADEGPTVYEAVLAPAAGPARRATLWRNGALVLSWSVEGDRITGTGPVTGLSLDRGPFLAWIRANLDAAGQEEATVLRRVCSIGLSRAIDLDRFGAAGDVHPPDRSCYTYRPEVAPVATRMRGSCRPTERDGVTGGR